MRVGVISTTFGNPWAGSEELWYQTSLSLLEDGHKVRASVFEPNKFCKQHSVFKDSGGVLDYRPRFKNGRIHQLKNRFKSNYKDFFKWNPDVLLLSLGSVGDLMMHTDLKRELLKSKAKIIPICLFNADYISYSEAVRKELTFYYKKSISSVFVSQHNHELLERQLAIKIEPFHIFSSPTSYQFDERQKLPLLPIDGTINFACAARFDVHIKGYDVLLKAFASKDWLNRDFHLNIYGSGSGESYIKELINLYQLESKVTFKGFVNDTRDIWKENHFKVMASRAEGLSLAILEAMICGRVPIVTDVGENGFLIKDGHNGFLAEAPVPKYFSKALNRAWESLTNYNVIAENAVQTVSKVFDINPINRLKSIISAAYEKK